MRPRQVLLTRLSDDGQALGYMRVPRRNVWKYEPFGWRRTVVHFWA